MKIKIYIPYHREFPIKLKSDIFIPIQVWRELSELKLDMIWDNSWDNISNLNKEFCELTAMYWVWKNQEKTDYIWFYHYRRFLAFKQSKENVLLNVLNKIWFLKLIDSIGYSYNFETKSIENEIKKSDIFLSKNYKIFWL